VKQPDCAGHPLTPSANPLERVELLPEGASAPGKSACRLEVILAAVHGRHQPPLDR
jgi:hypothetical protein